MHPLVFALVKFLPPLAGVGVLAYFRRDLEAALIQALHHAATRFLP